MTETAGGTAAAFTACFLQPVPERLNTTANTPVTVFTLIQCDSRECALIKGKLMMLRSVLAGVRVLPTRAPKYRGDDGPKENDGKGVHGSVHFRMLRTPAGRCDLL